MIDHPSPSDPLQRTLSDALAALSAGPLLVGFSGGLDSTALLHALAALPAARARGMQAIHVDHRLNPSSAKWAEHCARICAALDVASVVVAVDVAAVGEFGIEGAARKARYAAFDSQLAAGGFLTLAHHRDDQAETLLLRLLHGAGHEGLAGMRRLRRFAQGWLWRPLLGLGRDDLQRYARRHDLQWIEDPSNSDAAHARNHLRNSVMPTLAARWPDAARRIAASATRLRDESDLLDAAARDAFDRARLLVQVGDAVKIDQGLVTLESDEATREVPSHDPRTLDLDTLRALSPPLRRAVVGLWLDSMNLPRPPPGIWSRIAPDLLEAREDAAPLLAWRGAELRRYRDAIYAMPPLVAAQNDWELTWDGLQTLRLPGGFGCLSLEPATCFASLIVVRPRRGGERLAQPGSHRELRTLLQDLGLPPWVRDRLPLLCAASGEVLAAADVALSPRFAEQLRQRGARLRWQRAD